MQDQEDLKIKIALNSEAEDTEIELLKSMTKKVVIGTKSCIWRISIFQ